MWRIKLKFNNLFSNIHIKKLSDKTSKQAGHASLWGLFLNFLFKIIVLSIGTCIILFPFYYMIAGSLMSEKEITDTQQIHWYPKKLQWGNFAKAFEEGYWQALGVSAAITIMSIILKIIVTILMGYAFSLPKWRGKKIAWYTLLSIMMLPEVALMAGQYRIVTILNFREGIMLFASLSLPFIASVFSALMFRNAFESIPVRTKESALIDGCSEMKYFLRVAVPMISPTTWTVGILTAFAAWNSYMWPSLLIGASTSDYHVMSTWLFTTGKAVDENDPIALKIQIRLAGAILAILPMFIAYFVMRSRIMKAISRRGSTIKG